MDVPDVELVVVFGIPDTVSQLYQVHEDAYTLLVIQPNPSHSCVAEQGVVVGKQGLT